MISDRDRPESLIMESLMRELVHLSTTSPFVKRVDEYSAAFACHPGNVRKRNEDKVVQADIQIKSGFTYRCAIVCDGVGGLQAGDMASAVAVSAFVAFITASEPRRSLADLLEATVRHVDDVVRHELNGRGATTLCALVRSHEGEVAAVSIGDSRIYSWEPQSHLIRQVSIDDTIENELRGLNLHNASVLDARGLRGSLSQAIGEVGRSSESLRVSILTEKDLQFSGAILATDGVWRSSEEAFNLIATNCHSAAELARRAITFAAWAGGVDNSSLFAIEDISQFGADLVAAQLGQGARCSVWLGDSKVVVPITQSNAETQQSIKDATFKKRLPRRSQSKHQRIASLAFEQTRAKPQHPDSLNETIEVSDDERPEKP